MKKYMFLGIAFLFSLFIIPGCQSGLMELPDNPVVFRSGDLNAENEDTGYRTVEREGKIYIVFGSINPKGLSGDVSYAYEDCLGYVDDDKADRIYKLKDESADEWLIEYYVGGIMDEPVVLREITTKGKTDIPLSVKSFEYDFWEE